MPRDPVPPWTVVLGRGARTHVEVSASCLLVVVLIAAAFRSRVDDLVPGLGPAAWAVGAAVGVLVYAAALVHESAHAVVARRHGHPVPSVRIAAAGGRTVVDGYAASPGEEALTAVAGPAVSLVLGLAALAARLVVHDGVPALVLEALVVANLLIGLVDLLPAPPLDGGRLVRAAAWRATGSRARGALVAGRVGLGVAVAVLLVPVLQGPVTGTRPGVSTWAVCVLLAVLAWAGSSAQVAGAHRQLQSGAAGDRRPRRPRRRGRRARVTVRFRACRRATTTSPRRPGPECTAARSEPVSGCAWSTPRAAATTSSSRPASASSPTGGTSSTTR